MIPILDGGEFMFPWQEQEEMRKRYYWERLRQQREEERRKIRNYERMETFMSIIFLSALTGTVVMIVSNCFN